MKVKEDTESAHSVQQPVHSDPLRSTFCAKRESSSVESGLSQRICVTTVAKLRDKTLDSTNTRQHAHTHK